MAKKYGYEEMLEDLESLVRKGLIERVDTPRGQGYRITELGLEVGLRHRIGVVRDLRKGKEAA